MLRRHFLIDASALVPFFLPEASSEGHKARAAIAKLLSLREDGRAFLHVPNFCMAECSKAFAAVIYKRTKSQEKALGEYRALVETLLDTVSRSRKGLIQSHELTRKHLVDIEDIFHAQWSLKPRHMDKLLSGLDALILSVGRSLHKTYGPDNVRVVTADQWMATVCNQNQNFLPKAIYVYSDPIPDR